MTAPGFKRSAKDLLWALLVLSIIALLIIVAVEIRSKTFQFDRANWLFLFAGFSALIGWLTAAIVALRNSTKQHTINVLLQSRLSTAFNERVKDFTKCYPLGVNVAEADLDKKDDTTVAALEGLKYLLNYHEFVAIGICHGDLDHDLLNDSIQGIVVGLYEKGEPYIKRRRAADPQTLEYLHWLYNEWKPKN